MELFNIFLDQDAMDAIVIVSLAIAIVLLLLGMDDTNKPDDPTDF